MVEVTSCPACGDVPVYDTSTMALYDPRGNHYVGGDCADDLSVGEVRA